MLRWGYARPGWAFVVACAVLALAECCALVLYGTEVSGVVEFLTVAGTFGGGVVAGMLLSRLCLSYLLHRLPWRLLAFVVFLGIAAAIGGLIAAPVLLAMPGGTRTPLLMPLLPLGIIFLLRASFLMYSSLLDAIHHRWTRRVKR